MLWFIWRGSLFAPTRQILLGQSTQLPKGLPNDTSNMTIKHPIYDGISENTGRVQSVHNPSHLLWMTTTTPSIPHNRNNEHQPTQGFVRCHYHRRTNCFPVHSSHPTDGSSTVWAVAWCCWHGAWGYAWENLNHWHHILSGSFVCFQMKEEEVREKVRILWSKCADFAHLLNFFFLQMSFQFHHRPYMSVCLEQSLITWPLQMGKPRR